MDEEVGSRHSRESRGLTNNVDLYRLKGCKRDADVWQRILKVRALVVTPHENTEMWVKFANLCRKSGRLSLAEKTLNSLLGDDAAAAGMSGPPPVIYAHLKYLWATGARDETLAFLRVFTGRLSSDLGLPTSDSNQGQRSHPSQELQMSGKVAEYTKLLARCYYKLGEWQMTTIEEDWGSDLVKNITQSYLMATSLDSNWYKAWHAWALANSEIVSHFTKMNGGDETLPDEVYQSNLVPSVHAYFKSIALSPGNSLQDTLRLLTMWFKYGHDEDVTKAVLDGFRTVSVDTWLDVIPQV